VPPASGRTPVTARACAIPRWSSADTLHAIQLAAIFPAAFLPEPLFIALVRWRTQWQIRRRAPRLAPFAATLLHLWGEEAEDGLLEAWLVNTQIHRALAERYLLRQYLLPHRRPPVRLRGREHVAAALARGRGAILWVAPTVYASLFVKMAFAAEGFRVHHLSRWSHGPSRSLLGSRLLNRIYTRIEDRHLEARVMILPGRSPLAATRTLRRLLEANALVSITVIGTGDRVLRVPLRGHVMTVAQGAPRLALASGAALLPVFCARRGDVVETRVSPPLALPSGPADRAVAAAGAALARCFESFIAEFPDQLGRAAGLFLDDPERGGARGEE